MIDSVASLRTVQEEYYEVKGIKVLLMQTINKQALETSHFLIEVFLRR